MIYGTYLHGVLEAPTFRKFFLNLIRPGLAKESLESDYSLNVELEVARVSAKIKDSLDMDLFSKLFLEVE